ncbi:hypothetical protein EVG20_g3801 [Dentipellis fragilis]|uniref:Uncharacterized protein n=1 Tax=Dentipellis fragilis TaxID=205917 RepID=A0A4Y9YZP8_9AGAM|nr:hypothetical protein EVG20_g3801 [Dentipellis fragilis]
MAPTTRARKKATLPDGSDPFVSSSMSPRLPTPVSMEDDAMKDVLSEVVLPTTTTAARRPVMDSQRNLRGGIEKHPGRAAGLEKKTRSQIQAEAGEKKVTQAKKKADKDAAAARMEEKKSADLRELALLQDKRAKQDRTEASSIAQAPGKRYRADSQSESQCEESDDRDDSGPEVELTAAQKEELAEWDRYVKRHGLASIARARTPSKPTSTTADKITAEKKDAQPVLTAAEKKEARINADREQVAAARKQPVKRKTTVRNEAPVTKKTKSASGALKKDWRQVITKTLSTPARASAPQQRQKKANADETLSSDSSDGVSGLDDNFVSVTKETATRLAQMKPPKLFVSDLTSDDDAPTITKTPRSASSVQSKKAAADAESMAVTSLPEWAQPKFYTHCAPTIRALVGVQHNVWDLEGKGLLFLSLVQQAVDAVWPQKHYIVRTSKDQMYNLLRQCVYDWRKAIGRAALRVVQAAAVLVPKKQLAKWSSSALDECGAAFWENPRAEPPTGALRSQFIAATFAVHIKLTVGSMVDDDVFPAGTLALCLAAVERGFVMYKTGRFIKGPEFAQKYVGESTKQWLDDAVLDFVRRPKRVDALVMKARAIVVQQPPSAPINKSRGFKIVEASSPPVSDDEWTRQTIAWFTDARPSGTTKTLKTAGRDAHGSTATWPAKGPLYCPYRTRYRHHNRHTYRNLKTEHVFASRGSCRIAY